MPRWKFHTFSHRGPRPENQDNYLWVYPDGQCAYLRDQVGQQGQVVSWPEGHIRMAVVDGMGGHQSGREFAEQVVLELQQIPFQRKPESLQAQLVALHDKLFERCYRNSRSPGSTLVMADITPEGGVLLANMGDSRAYLVRGKVWEQLTHDQTMTEFAWRDGLITDAEYAELTREQPGKVAQALGYGCTRWVAGGFGDGIASKRHDRRLSLNLDGEHPDIFTLEMPPETRLLLASDGLWSGRDGQATAGSMATQAHKVRDNITFLTLDYPITRSV